MAERRSELAHGQRRKHAKKHAGQQRDEQRERQYTAIQGYAGHGKKMLGQKGEQTA